MRRFVVLAALISVALLASACTPTQFITMRTVIPPELDVPLYIKNVAVLEFDGHSAGGKIVAAKLEQELLNNQYYKVIERSEIAGIINEKNFQQTDLVENNEFLQEMKIKNVQGLITGSVATFHPTTERGVDERQQRYMISAAVFNNKFEIVRPARYGYRTIREPWIMKQGNVNASFKLVDISGQIIASISRGGAYSSNKIKNNAPVPTDSQVLDLAALDAVKKFIKKISVWTEVSRLKLKNGKNCATGNNFAANGLFDKAEEQFKVATGIQGNYAAFYNLGLAMEAQGRYADAKAAYDQGLTIRPSDKEMMTAITRVTRKQGNEARLKKLRELRGQ